MRFEDVGFGLFFFVKFAKYSENGAGKFRKVMTCELFRFEFHLINSKYLNDNENQ